MIWTQYSASVRGFGEVLFWASAATLFYVYAGYPLLLLLLAAVTPRRRRPEQSDEDLPFLSVLIAAYNEEVSIGKKLQETLALDYPAGKLEVIVLSDGSTDRTDAIVRSVVDPRVRLLRVEGRRGKTHAQNEGVKACKGKVVVFSDATTIYHPLALRYLASSYGDPAVGAVSGRYQYFDRGGNSPTGVGTIAFWNYENLIKTLQSRIKTITGCCGCIYSVRKDLYTELPDNIISDLVQPLWVIKQGYRVVFEDRALAYEETTKSVGEEFSMRVRVVSRAMHGILSVAELLSPWKYGWVAFQLLSHKILRWLVPVFLVTLFTSSAILAAAPGAFRLFFYAQVLFYLAALLAAWIPAARSWKPLTVPLYFCTLNAAALMSLLSLLELYRGSKYVVWEPVRDRSDEASAPRSVDLR
jgi:cellulose synthase/poly-beta-1,6-N-acetylglucosamine synthase-like glycosyltransferase